MRPYSALINYFQVTPTLLQAALRASTWTIFCPQPRMKIIPSLWAGKPRPYSAPPNYFQASPPRENLTTKHKNILSAAPTPKLSTIN